MWQSIVDVDNVRHAVDKLRETNWLYRTVDDDIVDEATKKTIEVVSIASNPILERASVDDINGLPFVRWIRVCFYTCIRTVDSINKLLYRVTPSARRLQNIVDSTRKLLQFFLPQIIEHKLRTLAEPGITVHEPRFEVFTECELH